jgi:glycosyltransferase involved in cell wall biosynthesis
MPVKNEEIFIGDAINGVINQKFKDWELIIVDDNSNDRTIQKAEECKNEDSRIKIFQNTQSGLIQALNYGFYKTSGEYIKMIDGDDIILPSFSEYIDLIVSNEATYHDGYVVDENLNKIDIHHISSRFRSIEFPEFIKKINLIVSPPRWSWTISRNVASKIFPLYSELPSPKGGDIYIGLMIKKHFSISYIKKPLYLYRQHLGQLYGGIYNFNPVIVNRRAKSMLKIINIIELLELLSNNDNSNKIISNLREYYRLMSKANISIKELLNSSINNKEKLKVFIVKKLPDLAEKISRHKSKFNFMS